MEIDRQIFVEGVAIAVERVLRSEDGAQRLVNAVAAAVADSLELVDQEAAAALLGVTTKTLARNASEWGLDKSVAFGSTNPRYFLSQILQRARQTVVKGRRQENERPALRAA